MIIDETTQADRLHAYCTDELHAVDVGRGDGPELYPA